METAKNRKNRVAVLLATLNGEKYLKEQIDSIFSQKEVEVSIFVADDCSTDNTVSILNEYKKKYPNFTYYVNKENKNFTYNFIDLYFSLLKEQEFDYYAFSDQDDYWKEDKLISAINKIQNDTNPNGCLYCSNLILADQNLNPYGIQENKRILKTPRYSYLISNLATGCTIVVNRRFYCHSTKVYPKNIYLHDYWLFLIAVYTASYYYDFEGHILYRQHSGNQIGSNKVFFSKNKLNQFINPKHWTSDLIKEFYQDYQNDIYSKDLPYVKTVATYRENFLAYLKLLFSIRIRRRKFNALFKLRVLFKKH